MIERLIEWSIRNRYLVMFLASALALWAAEQGFKLVPSKKTPARVTWVGVSDPQP